MMVEVTVMTKMKAFSGPHLSVSNLPLASGPKTIFEPSSAKPRRRSTARLV